MAEKPKATKKKSGSGKGSGKLKISNNWNAISIIALSQNNPLKALAEFVENSIDANATEITLVRGKDRGQYYLKIIDNGDGIDDFTYVATHIADSVKAKLKKEGAEGIQGEFGIGLLSFWTVGEELTITSTGSEGVTRRMHLVRNNPGYSLQQVNKLIGDRGTTLLIRPILAGVRRLTGEKIQHYLASELRERINRRGVLIKINDRRSRKELVVEPHKFSGRLLHHLPSVAGPFGEVYHEIYLNTPSHENRVGLYRNGTRVLPSLSSIDHFNQEPWNSGYLTGIVDVPFLQLTPGTRDGIVYDDAFESFAVSMDPLGQALQQIIEEQKRAEEETASRKILHRISKAIKEALSFLPEEEYGWLSIGVGGGSRGSDKENIKTVYKKADAGGQGSADGPAPGSGTGEGAAAAGENPSAQDAQDVQDAQAAQEGEPAQADGYAEPPIFVAEPERDAPEKEQKEFFDIPGPLAKASVSPSKAVVPVGETKRFSVVAKDRKGTKLDAGYQVVWEITDGAGWIDEPEQLHIEYNAPEEPCVTNIGCLVSQGETEVFAEAIVTVTAELGGGGRGSAGLGLEDSPAGERKKKGLPGYTYRKAPGELWRSRYDGDRYLIIINNGHADFIYASKQKRRKLRYIAKLFAKELVLANFPELTREKVLEKMIELQLYTEENL